MVTGDITVIGGDMVTGDITVIGGVTVTGDITMTGDDTVTGFDRSVLDSGMIVNKQAPGTVL